MNIFDAHNDFITEFSSENKLAKYIKNQIQNNSVCSSVWATNLNEIEAINYIEKINKLKEDHHNLYSLVEDCHFINSTNLDIVLAQKINIAGLVWNDDNNLGGGCYGKSGLTKLGAKVIKELESNGIMIDTAHMNENTFWDFVQITTKPLFNSHCNIKALNSHKRNLDSKQIEQIINSGGLVCLSFVKYFLSKKKVVSVKDVVRQIKYFVDNYGYKNLSIGSDFFGTKELPIGLKKYLDFIGLKKELLSIGLSRKVVHCLFYKNLNDFYEKNK